MTNSLNNPVADKRAIVKGEEYRFTILTDKLIRIEYAKDGSFEDRQTQVVVNRFFPVPEYSVKENDGTIKIETSCMQLTYYGGRFTENSLNVRFRGKMNQLCFQPVWYFGTATNALPGTLRTLDCANGEKTLPKSIMSRSSVTVLDDSKSLALVDDCLSERNADNIDMYIFAYPRDYKACLNAYYTLTGKTPLLPRFALGNWWSRYYKYTDNEYLALMKKFEKENIPLSVAVIDMDWHKVDIDPKYGTGWTGFSWETELFKNPAEFLQKLHDMNLKVSLNVHPHGGIAAHEDCYEEAAKAVGLDPDNSENIDFDCTDKKFMDAYFNKALKPLANDGVDFWFVDWQQGNISKIKGLDPLWALNHLHYHDNCQNNNRGILLGRFPGFGGHRYPIGFSGDSTISWESLDFQPYFTASASNVGYGWWSHDLGGHMGGSRDDELMNRWTQFGTFSPITRYHCCQNIFISHEPWDFNNETCQSMKKFMRLRFEMIPYLYTMNYRAYNDNMPLTTPVYYEYPTVSEAYEIKNEYFFGTELLVCPITHKKDDATQMGSTTMYIPEGVWFDFFNKYKYTGGRKVKMYRKYDEMPLLAKAGAIIPTSKVNGNSIENPEEIILNIFPGANNTFTLYEDDGKTRDYENGKFVKTEITLDWDNKQIKIAKPVGDLTLIPNTRRYKIILNSVNNVRASSNASILKRYSDNAIIIDVKEPENAVIKFSSTLKILENNYIEKVYNILYEAHTGYDEKNKIYKIIKEKSKTDAIAYIYSMNIDENLKNAIFEALL